MTHVSSTRKELMTTIGDHLMDGPKPKFSSYRF
jgi:hypothetical protein